MVGVGDELPVGPVTARPAATVLLLRDGVDGIEVYMQKRHAEMAFAASAHIFPGGSMDERDGSDEVLRLLGDVDLVEAAARMGLGAGELGHRRCLALHVTAIRELAEEAGVLLARGLDGSPVAAAEAESLCARLRGGADFAGELLAAGLCPSAEELTYVAHIVTPVDQPRRYDTHFFAAPAPPGQEAIISGEATEGGWFSSAAALTAGAAGDILLMPPTRILCAEVGRHASVGALVADLGARPVPTMLFRLPRLLRGPIPDHLPTAGEVAASDAFE
jgi:8-oxo-dGTP pyrophosphatase MutT (NUDIX family)